METEKNITDFEQDQFSDILIGKKISEKELKNMKVEETYHFHIYGQRRRSDGGGSHHSVGTNRPTSNPANCDSYWVRQRTDGTYNPYASRFTPNSGEMCWVLYESGEIRLGCIMPEGKIFIEPCQRVVNKKGNVFGLAFYKRRQIG